MSVAASAKALARPVLFRTLGTERTQELSRRVQEMTTSLQYGLSTDGKLSVQNLERFRNRYAGKRCFVIGNGPSLREMDLSPLSDEYTFGLNRIYLMFEKLGFATTFLVSVNKYVSEQSGDEMAVQPCEKFLSWRAGRPAPAGPRLSYLRTNDAPGFSKDPTSTAMWEGATVTYVALQLAYYFGFTEVILIGVDHSFATKGEPHKLVTSEAGDPNHFDPSYFGKGYRWQLPDLETSEIAYGWARRTYEADGRRILDATVGGKLRVFPKVVFDDVVNMKKAS